MVGVIQLDGTWQVLVRSTFRETSTLPSTVKFTAEQRATVRLVRVRSVKYVVFSSLLRYNRVLIYTACFEEGKRHSSVLLCADFYHFVFYRAAWNAGGLS